MSKLYTMISESAVWALTNSGSIYRRSGITQQNYCGNNWDLIPGSFKFISGKPSFQFQIQEFSYKSFVDFISFSYH